MANLNQIGAKDAGEKHNDFRLAVLSRVVALALLTPLVGYLLEGSDNGVVEVIRDYYHSELFVFLLGSGVIACVEALAWLLRLPFMKGAVNCLTGRCN